MEVITKLDFMSVGTNTNTKCIQDSQTHICKRWVVLKFSFCKEHWNSTTYHIFCVSKVCLLLKYNLEEWLIYISFFDAFGIGYNSWIGLEAGATNNGSFPATSGPSSLVLRVSFSFACSLSTTLSLFPLGCSVVHLSRRGRAPLFSTLVWQKRCGFKSPGAKEIYS